MMNVVHSGFRYQNSILSIHFPYSLIIIVIISIMFTTILQKTVLIDNLIFMFRRLTSLVTRQNAKLASAFALSASRIFLSATFVRSVHNVKCYYVTDENIKLCLQYSLRNHVRITSCGFWPFSTPLPLELVTKQRSPLIIVIFKLNSHATIKK